MGRGGRGSQMGFRNGGRRLFPTLVYCEWESACDASALERFIAGKRKHRVVCLD